MTPPALATAVGSAAQTIRDYENAKSIPGGEVLAGMSKLGVDVAYVLTGTGQTVLIEAKTYGVKEGAASAYGGVTPSVDSVLLQGVIDFFDAWLEQHKDKVRISRDRHGAVISILYRTAAQRGRVERPELEQILSLVA